MVKHTQNASHPEDVSRETSGRSSVCIVLPDEADIQAGLTGMGIAVDVRSVRLLMRHARLMLEENERQNLTRLTSPNDVLVRHILDSATALPFVEAAPHGAVADLGSGAGYPGVVVSVLGARHVVLVESERRKASFLSTVVADLEVDAEVSASRAEEVAIERANSFAVVVARAVAPLASLVELASPLLVCGGRLVALKGASVAGEVAAGDAAGRLCGMARVECVHVDVPGSDREHMILVYERRGHSRERLPRRSGAAQRHPLA